MVNVKSYVRIAEDKKEAWLYLCAPEEGTRYEKPEIMRYLQLNGATVLLGAVISSCGILVVLLMGHWFGGVF